MSPVPATIVHDDLREKMRSFIDNRCLLTDQAIRLSGGGKSSFFFDCKQATLDGEFLLWLSDYILDDIVPHLPAPPEIVGGLTLGADSISAALSMRAHQLGKSPSRACIVRKEPKKYGTQKLIENAPDSPARIMVTEDVITSGGSAARACKAFLEAGHQIAAIVVIVDRESGGREALEKNFKVPIFCIFNKSDFSRAAQILEVPLFSPQQRA